MSKTLEYIQLVLKDNKGVPGRVDISAKQYYDICLLSESLNESRRQGDSYSPRKRDSIGNNTPKANSAAEAIDSYNFLLKKLGRIKILHLTSYDTPDIFYLPLNNLTSLIHLKLDMIPPSTIQGLYELRHQLQSLDIYNSGITALAPVIMPVASKMPTILKYLRPMTSMNGDGTRVSETMFSDTADDNSSSEHANIPFEYLWSTVISLKLNNCGISRLDESFHFFPLLASLDLSKNQFSHVFHLQDCYRLKFLNLSHNRVKVLSNLHLVIGNIKVLDLSDNSIESIHGLDRLLSLQNINLSQNCIDDINEVLYLAKLPMLEAVDLHDNPISKRANYRFNVYSQFIESGGMLSAGGHSLPKLDGDDPTDEELRTLKGLMFRPLEEKGSTSHYKNMHFSPSKTSISSRLDHTDEFSCESNSIDDDSSGYSRNGSYSVVENQSTTTKQSLQDIRVNSDIHGRKQSKITPISPMSGRRNHDYQSNDTYLRGESLGGVESILSLESKMNEPSGDEYKDRSNPRLLTGWILARKNLQISNQNSFNQSKFDAPELRKRAIENYSNIVVIGETEESTEVHPSLEEIKQILLRNNHNAKISALSDANAANNSIDHKDQGKLLVDKSTLIQNQRQSSNGTGFSPRSYPQREASANRSPLGSMHHIDGAIETSKDNSNHDRVKAETMANSLSIDRAESRQTSKLPSQLYLDLDDSNYGDEGRSIETNLQLDMNDLSSIHSDILAGSSAGGGNSEATAHILHPSANHHSKYLSNFAPSTVSNLTNISSAVPLTPFDLQSNSGSILSVDPSPRSHETSPRENPEQSNTSNHPIETGKSEGLSGQNDYQNYGEISPNPFDDHEDNIIQGESNGQTNLNLDTNTLNEEMDVTSIAGSRAYRGSEEYANLLVMDNLDLYFREQIFTNDINKPYIRYPTSNNMTSDTCTFIDSPSRSERFIAVFCERIVIVQNKRSPTWKPPVPGAYIPSSPGKGKKSNKDNDKGQNSAQDWDEPYLIIAVTNVNAYVLKFDEFHGKIFIDAPVPTIVAIHDISELM